MFITKKAYEEAIAEAVSRNTEQWERKLREQDEWHWREVERCRQRDEVDKLRERVYNLEKKLGLVEDTPQCPLAVHPNF